MEKLNNVGFIPNLREIEFSSDGNPKRLVYFKRTDLMMGIFQGVGISQVILERNTKYDEIVIVFESRVSKDSEYTGVYLAKMEQFRRSTKKYANGYNDVQRFVSFKDMVRIK